MPLIRNIGDNVGEKFCYIDTLLEWERKMDEPAAAAAKNGDFFTIDQAEAEYSEAVLGCACEWASEHVFLFSSESRMNRYICIITFHISSQYSQ